MWLAMCTYCVPIVTHDLPQIVMKDHLLKINAPVLAETLLLSVALLIVPF